MYFVTVLGSLKMKGTHRGSVCVPFRIIMGVQWLIRAAVENAFGRSGRFSWVLSLGLFFTFHISVRITRTGHVGSVSAVNTFPFPYS